MGADSALSQLYASTVDFFPSAVYFVCAGVKVITAIGLSVLYFFIIKYEKKFGPFGDFATKN